MSEKASPQIGDRVSFMVTETDLANRPTGNVFFEEGKIETIDSTIDGTYAKVRVLQHRYYILPLALLTKASESQP